MDSSCFMSLGSIMDLPDDPGFDTFLWHIYRKQKVTNVEFELKTPNGSVTFKAHRLVLALWSPKFADQFYNTEKQNNLERVSVKNTDPEVFEDMLNFMYEIDPDLDSIRKAFDLYKLATFYRIKYLADKCKEFLTNFEVAATNVFDLMEVAKHMEDRNLMDECMGVIQTKTRSLLSLYECCDITPSMVRTILACPALSLEDELELLNWLFAWAKNRYYTCSEFSNDREVLEEFLPQLNFLALTNSQFATVCKNHNEFFKDKEALSIFMNIGIRDSMKLPYWYGENCKGKFRVYTG